MNNVDSIVIHCSATREGQRITAKDIEKMHLQRGFKTIGYHYVIGLDGTVERGRPECMEGAHCNTAGFSGVAYNKHSIGICYVGGLDTNMKPKDTRTQAQKDALHKLVADICRRYKIKEIIGHRDTSPDKNGNKKIESFEWIKSCPCFDVIPEFTPYIK